MRLSIEQINTQENPFVSIARAQAKLLETTP
jgi:hypothetical protein